MRTLLALAALCLPSVAVAQSSWDVTVSGGTGAMAMLAGRSYRVPNIRASFPLNLELGSAGETLGGVKITVAVMHSRTNGDNSAVIAIEAPHAIGQRYEPIAKAALKRPGPGASFNGTAAASDGGSVTVTVTANP
jgi:hypothetical protein